MVTLPNGGVDTLATLSPRGWVGAKCDFWKPMGRTTGGEELNRDPRRLVTPAGSADMELVNSRALEQRSYMTISFEEQK